MTFDWTTSVAITIILSFLVVLVRWVQSAFSIRDARIVELELKVAVLEANSDAMNKALIAAEGRTASAMEGLRSDVKDMANQLNQLYKIIINERDR